MKNFPLGCTILPAWCQKVSASGWDSTTQLSVMLLPRTARSCWSGTHIIGGTKIEDDRSLDWDTAQFMVRLLFLQSMPSLMVLLTAGGMPFVAMHM